MTDAPFASASGASWCPLLTGAARDDALQAVDALAASVAEAHGHGDPSLSAGSAGLAVLFAQLARAERNEDAPAIAGRFIDDAIDVLSRAPLGPSLYPGFTGIAWAAELLSRLDDRERDPDEDPNEAIDDALRSLLARSNWEEGPYDVILGLTGLGVYAMERLPRPAAADCVVAVIGHLTRRARHDENGTYWYTGPSLLLPQRRGVHPAGGIDLGVAHGIAGVIPFLACARAAGVADASTDTLLDGAVAWLLAHAVETDAGPTIPSFLAEGIDPVPARSAWCYGDPGVAAALMVAGRAADKADWSETAMGLALRAAERPPAESGVVDAGFCHGSAGLAHLFNRMHQTTGEPRLAKAARFWLDQTLERWRTGRGQPAAWTGPGLLEGAAGVALALLAASTPAEPIWDRMFVVSRLGPGS